MSSLLIFLLYKPAGIKKMLLAGLFLLACFSARSAEIQLVSRDADGVLLRYGAGWLNGQPLSSPVGDDAVVAFIAPMPEYENSPDAQFQASYLAGSSGLTMLLSGVDPFSILLGTPLRCSNTQIAANAAMNVFAILCDERSSSASAATSASLQIKTNLPESTPISLQLGNSPTVLAANCQVSLSANGNRLLSYGENIPIKLHTLSGNAIASSLDLSTKIPYNGKRVALSGNGNYIFFAANLPGYGLLAGQNGVFSYRLSDDSLAFVCAAGGISLDPELAVSADGKLLVFRRLTGALAVAELQNGHWLCSSDYPIRAATCGHPSVSADGRFIAYQASLAANNIMQVYRYDRWRKVQELVSENISGDPANADCLSPAISADGRQISFVSAANNLIGGAINGQYHVYRRELENPLIAADWMMLSLRRGWNPVAIPFTPSPESMTRLRDCAGGLLWTWDNNKRRFAPLPGVASVGQGFWLYAENDCAISISGSARKGEVKVSAPGWHLLGPAQVSGNPSLPLDSQNQAEAIIFAFNHRSGSVLRLPESSLEYGRAAWVFVKHGVD